MMNHIKPRTWITGISIAACVFLSACQLADPQADTPCSRYNRHNRAVGVSAGYGRKHSAG